MERETKPKSQEQGQATQGNPFLTPLSSPAIAQQHISNPEESKLSASRAAKMSPYYAPPHGAPPMAGSDLDYKHPDPYAYPSPPQGWQPGPFGPLPPAAPTTMPGNFGSAFGRLGAPSAALVDVSNARDGLRLWLLALALDGIFRTAWAGDSLSGGRRASSPRSPSAQLLDSVASWLAGIALAYGLFAIVTTAAGYYLSSQRGLAVVRKPGKDVWQETKKARQRVRGWRIVMFGLSIVLFVVLIGDIIELKAREEFLLGVCVADYRRAARRDAMGLRLNMAEITMRCNRRFQLYLLGTVLLDLARAAVQFFILRAAIRFVSAFHHWLDEMDAGAVNYRSSIPLTDMSEASSHHNDSDKPVKRGQSGRSPIGRLLGRLRK
ncbi:hypothetical protein PYCC9005_002705 [Savitreella phatthalungensis]